jgi:hypothetical protein
MNLEKRIMPRRLRQRLVQWSRCGAARCSRVIFECDPRVERTVPGSALGRAFSPTQDLRFYSSRLAMRAVRRTFTPRRAGLLLN